MFPQALLALPQWICWQGVPDPTKPGKIKKIPINPRTGGNAQSNNPATWSDYQTALAASSRFSGLGFMFGGGIFGVDIDDVSAEIAAFKAGDNSNIVAEFVYTLESYSEYSQSGNGIHIICQGILPAGGRRKGNVEMYSEGRFFVMTGQPAAEYADIRDCTEDIKFLHAKYIGSSQPQAVRPVKPAPLDLDEQRIIEIASRSKQGQAFQTLFNGFWQGLYQSQSEADLAFCNMLAFWCGCDKAKMDSIFRKSGLMRPKWEREQYREGNLNKAINDCREVYSPQSGLDGYSITIRDTSAPPKKYSYDDTGNAERFTALYGQIVRYNYIDKKWLFYTGKKWQKDFTGQIKTLIDELLEDMKKEFAWCETEDEEKAFSKHLKYTRSSKGKTALQKETEHRVSILPADFDRSIYALNTQNGVLNLQTGQLAEHRYDQYLSKVTNTEYSDKVDCPQWKGFLEDIFARDRELIRYVQKAVGYSLTGSTQEQCIFFCLGNGRNGKSTFIDAIADIMGDYAINIQPETIMVKQFQSNANSDIARLKGARFVTTVEPNEGMRLNEGLVKQITGGDRVTARHLYGDEFEFTPEFKIWMGTNHKPIIRGRDEGIWRRLHLIPFNVQIPADKVDKNLKYKLKREYVGILNWAVEGCLLWQREGLALPKCVAQAVNEYKGEMDVVTAFLDECTERGPGEIRASDLYQAYRDWAKDNGQYVMSSTKFGAEVGQKYNKVRGSGGNKYLGLRLRGDYVPYQVNVRY